MNEVGYARSYHGYGYGQGIAELRHHAGTRGYFLLLNCDQSWNTN